MSKDYYTKAEVDKLLEIQKEEILKILNTPLENKRNTFELKAYKTRFLKFEAIDIIFHELLKNELIEEISKDKFRDAFLGHGINKESNNSLIKWKGAKNLCVYLLDSLEDHKLIVKDELNVKCKYVFGVKNAAQIKVKYRNNKNGLPGNYQIIDELRSKITSLYDKVDSDEDYFRNEILPEILDDF